MQGPARPRASWYVMLFPTPASNDALLDELRRLAATTGGTPAPTPHVTIGYFKGDADPLTIVASVRRRLEPPVVLRAAGLFAWSEQPHVEFGYCLSLHVQRDAAVQQWQRAVRAATRPAGLVPEYAWNKQQPHVQVVQHLLVPPAEALRRVGDRDYSLNFVGARVVITQRTQERYTTWLDEPLA